MCAIHFGDKTLLICQILFNEVLSQLDVAGAHAEGLDMSMK